MTGGNDSIGYFRTGGHLESANAETCSQGNGWTKVPINRFNLLAVRNGGSPVPIRQWKPDEFLPDDQLKQIS
jgi:hypothetical protein